ncbi:MAG TPA: CAP domain-containing protein [Actinomycetota bacterium]|nr:CAP domain-containing protein [Actinomycetota bacterium]
MRFRRLLILGSVIALLASAWAPAQAGSRSGTYRARLLRVVNDVRSHHGLRRLDVNVKLSGYAKRHSNEMADRRWLFHTNDLYSRVRAYRATAWGENVGVGGTIGRVVKAWMRSSGHRANVLNGRFRKTGIGVVKRAGRVWITQIYYG